MTSKEISPGEHFGRKTPSPKYTYLVEEYKVMHKHSDGVFNGRSLLKFVDIIGTYLKKNDCAGLWLWKGDIVYGRLP